VEGLTKEDEKGTDHGAMHDMKELEDLMFVLVIEDHPEVDD
jgi:hypothetical protein